MTMKELAKQAMKLATELTGRPANDPMTQATAFKLACAAMAQEKVKAQ